MKKREDTVKERRIKKVDHDKLTQEKRSRKEGILGNIQEKKEQQ